MATVKITATDSFISKNIKTSDYPQVEISNNSRNSDIRDNKRISGPVETSNYPISRINFSPINVKAESVLPFRIRFTEIDIAAYSARYPAPIGIGVIGSSFYIL
jgi:hypothetical protein